MIRASRMAPLARWAVAMLTLLAAAGAGDSWRAQVAARLGGLSPDRPEAYIDLAEDLMDRAASTGAAEDRELAQRLAALAGAIAPGRLGASAALFLADHAGTDAARARFRAVARALGSPSGAGPSGPDRSAAVRALVRAFEAYARGESARALEALAVPGAAELLDAHPAVLGGGSARFRADCAAMGGRTPPPVGAGQREALRVLAAAILSGGPRGWGEAMELGGDLPLPEVDVRDPASMFGVDPAECAWRDGRWVRAPAPAR
jgi:hypothetical protein